MLNHQSSPAPVETSSVAIDAIFKAAETYSIVASEDIIDVRGVKLWSKGQAVSTALQQKLLERKLGKPLEACLMAEDGVTLFSLLESLEAFCTNKSPLAMGLAPWHDVLIKQIKLMPLHSVAQLLLTTGLATRPQMIDHAVQAMALTGSMMAASKGSSVDVRIAMLAGLLHDIGEIYIQPEYLDHSGQLNLLGYKHLSVHPRIAQMLLASTTDYPLVLSRAIGEHHERLDGSGYPARAKMEQISPLGRMLAITEVALGIARAKSAPLTRISFALRVLPGEFDLQFAGFMSDLANGCNEVLPSDLGQSESLTIDHIADIQGRKRIAEKTREQLSVAKANTQCLEVVDVVQKRLQRLEVAWNALGYWGISAADLSSNEMMELDMAHRELAQRLRELEREAMLMTSKLPPAEQQQLSHLLECIQMETN